MRHLQAVLESIITSYNNQERINFVDLRELDSLLINRDLFQEFVTSYNNVETVNFFQIRSLENEVNN